MEEGTFGMYVIALNGNSSADGSRIEGIGSK